MLVAVVSSAATAVVPARRGAAPCATATSGVAVAAEAAWDIRRRSSASFSTLQQSSQAFRHRSVVAQTRRALSSSSSSSLRGIEMGVKRSLGARQTHKRLLSSSTRSQAADGELDELVATKQTGSSSGGIVLPAVGVACMGAILFGYHLGVVNGALEYIAKDLGFAADPILQGWVVSSTLAGATVGSFTGGSLADKIGCRRTFQLDAIPLLIGTLLSANAAGFQAMVIGRILVGFGIGVSSGVVPLYISEVSPTEIRGALGSVNQLSICVGILLALLAGLPLVSNPAWWRSMFAIATIPTVLLFLGMVYSPESPRWLYKQGRIAEAETSARRLWGTAKLESALAELKESNSDAGASEDAGWGDLFSRRYRKVVGVGMSLFLFQQFAGINAVVYFSTNVFRSAGIASDVAASALVGAANVIGTAVASSLMDKQGRKKLLITSFAGMAASMLLLSLALSWPSLEAYSGTLAVLGTVSYVLAFSLGAGPVPGLLLPEIFASRIRAKAVALSLGVHWISNFMIGLMFLNVVKRFGVNRVYLGFSAVCALAVLYISNNVVETKGRSLEEIERELSPAV
ncbi:unnamed protein product [Sphagnum troendelagicum]|uniref:Major facilitator superfamily (MFS) profile domain-containing protein n=1 Tax=Sphagnum troendelagicum TaxID=128251 RepID=A0ABP0TTV7_9BRYO